MTQFSAADKQLFKSKGISEQAVEQQIQRFINGFPYVQLSQPAIAGKGIITLPEEKISELCEKYDQYTGTVLKFVPASGAASRMFKAMFAFTDDQRNDHTAINDPQHKAAKQVIDNIQSFAFYKQLNQYVNINEAIKNKEYKKIIAAIIDKQGLQYGNQPKGLLLFHQYGTQSRTAIEEHFVEGAMYAKQSDNTVNIHFTVSPEHLEGFKQLINKVKAGYEEQYGVSYNVSFSQQKPSTDTIAVDPENQPFKEGDSILFRPGGHGALLENLNEQNEDLLFIKNIDNVVVDRLKHITSSYKKALAGILLELKEKVDNYIDILNHETEANTLANILSFTKDELNILPPNDLNINDTSILKTYLKQTLNKPIRVCGMVKNEGEPGGGPFWAVNSDGTTSLQIVEQAQIDLSNSEQEKIFNQSTHFNPVDLVCFIKDTHGKKFDLLAYRDPNTGFISKKSKDGRELKAQELPGLWNGSMAYWINVFVEVPVETFNPVKTINDLLRPNHQ